MSIDAAATQPVFGGLRHQPLCFQQCFRRLPPADCLIIPIPIMGCIIKGPFLEQVTAAASSP
jgi:hypothetical protein